MEDLYFEEQKIFDDAIAFAAEMEEGAVCDPKRFKRLAKEYGRLLKQMRRTTKVHDKTTGALNTKKVELQGKVNVDAMTGIYNRRYFESSLSKLKESLSISGSEMSILMMDVDFFKKYNDTYGHVDGDECLKAIAAALKETLHRSEDFVARYGGEEFVIVLPNTGEAGAKTIAENVLENVRAKKIPHEKNEENGGIVTISIGISTVRPNDFHDEMDYVKVADEALYAAKSGGRNRFEFVEFKEVPT
jgi:diguanylate cyclase (GGDEF)-like protein